MIVADANLIAYLLIRGPFTDAARRVLAKDPGWMAPVLWRSELANVLSAYMRRGSLTFDGAIEHYRRACRILDPFDHEVEIEDVLRLAAASRCSAYDCQYVLIAQETGLPLVTADRKVLAAFPGVAVSLEEFAAN